MQRKWWIGLHGNGALKGVKKKVTGGEKVFVITNKGVISRVKSHIIKSEEKKKKQAFF